MRPETRPQVPENRGELGAPETLPEHIASPEAGTDITEQTTENATIEQERVQAAPTPVVTAASRKDPMVADVERVLEDGMAETYAALPANAKQKFRVTGEQAATRIGKMLSRGSLKFKDIWKLIRDWLRVIPGVSRFFVEQEAKIKTDRIIRLAEKQKRQ